MFRGWYNFWFACVFLPCAISAYGSAGNPSFREHEDDDSEPVTTVIKCYGAENEVGTVSYLKIPMLDKYVILNLYVEPEYRRQGYGSALLEYACDHLKAIGAKHVYLQPGPFEMGKAPEGYLTTIKPTGEALAQQMQQLVVFYKDNGFVPAPQWLTQVIKWVYTCMGIDENAEYLMVKELI